MNRMPRPDEDMILIMGYRNETGKPLNGSIVLFYNEKEFRNNNFNLTEDRMYSNETRSNLNAITAYSDQGIKDNSNTKSLSGPNAFDTYAGTGNRNFSDLLSSKQKLFRSNNTWHFSNVSQGDEKYFFLNLHTTPEMIRDTNDVVTLTGMLIPDDPNAEIEEYNIELQIVASHDPNRMMLKNRRLNYRFTGTKREMEYKVQFQNTGKGPSRQISVNVSVPAMMDSGSLEILDIYPTCIYCDLARAGQSCFDTIIKKDSIYFVFKNIYLPGLREPGMTDPDSTIGFVKYRLHFNNELKKLPFESGASILFDKNKAINTNGSRGYFKPGNSPALIAGYNKAIGAAGKTNLNASYWTAGAAISTYSPYKKYLQAEFLVGIRNLPEQLLSRIQNKDTSIDNAPWRIIYRDVYVKEHQVNLYIVPLQLRYNLLDYLGAGIGSQLLLNANTGYTYRKEMQLLKLNGTNTIMITSTEKQNKWFKGFDVAAFADIQFGLVRVGPVGGIRYLHYFKAPQNVLFLYAAWRL